MDSALPWIGNLVEFVLLWRLIVWKAWRPYPYFFAFFAWIFVRLILLDVQFLTQMLDPIAYSRFFWYSSTFTAALRFLVFWEVYRHALPRRTAPHRFVTLLLSGTLAALAIFFNLAASEGMLFTLVISNISFAVAVCLLVILGFVRYYGVNPGRNIWGMATGTGILCAADVLAFSAFDLDQTLFPITRYVRPVVFLVQRAIWLPALWNYAPPALPQGQPLEPGLNAQSEVTPLRNAVASVRRAVGLKGSQTDEGESPSK